MGTKSFDAGKAFPRITVAYSGVHQAYQLALAAHEVGELERFYCSLLVAPGKWGRRLERVLGEASMLNRRCEGLPAEKAVEIPWPFLRNRIAERLGWRGERWSWHEANGAFDRAVARRLLRSESRLFVGAETCARDSMEVAKRRGMQCVLDVPQVHPAFLTRLLQEAADDLKVPAPQPFDPPELRERKAEEFALADVILVISDVHRRSFLEAGFAATKLAQIPLWADPALWFPPAIASDQRRGGPLRIVFVGWLGLRKGIPYLLRAMEMCGTKVELTLVGSVQGNGESPLGQAGSAIRVAGRKDKAQLRELFWNSDVLVLPSLIDTFGFVAMEAMACGLPVIVTENCGVPVPDESWRIPIMNAEAIAQRLLLYADDPELCRTDGDRAAEFARQFTPAAYRVKVGELFRGCLA